MFKVFRKMARGYESYKTYRGRASARKQLLQYDDRMLADNGFSRELLEKGVTGWPWRIETAQDDTLLARNGRLMSQSQAIDNLQSFSDEELQDLGISRGMIEQAVVSGRQGVHSEQSLKAA